MTGNVVAMQNLTTYLRLVQIQPLYGEHFKYVFINGIKPIFIQNELELAPESQIVKKWALVWVMFWRKRDDKLLHEQVLTQFTKAYMHPSASVGSPVIWT